MNYLGNTKEFLRIKRGYEQAALLLAQGEVQTGTHSFETTDPFT